MAAPSQTITSRKSPPSTWCCACEGESLNPLCASWPRSTTATR
ncbi:hypothetical protein IHE44_0010116 [Lamprotornis superbus]|uniref:Uncharacterized protein n=1 Tax=Lamprotornis superbus TaxID=245042 RepID=A0A835NGS2_9PASS|nr:hypothetical protein IHE44_0010116 [Lamprotornis superbus]